MEPYVIPLNKLGITDIETVGGKNASLGEMITHLSQAGVMVPGGFATTAEAYRNFLQHEGLAGRIQNLVDQLDLSGKTLRFKLTMTLDTISLRRVDGPDDLRRLVEIRGGIGIDQIRLKRNFSLTP